MPTVTELEARADELVASITDDLAIEDARKIEQEHKDVVAALRQARKAERRDLADAYNLDADFLRRHARKDDTMFKSEILGELRRRSDVNPTDPHVEVRAGELDERTTRVQAMADALYARVAPNHQPSAAARQFVGLRLHEMAGHCLREAGSRTTALSPATIIQRALHTTSDFPEILASTVGRSLRAAYELAPAAMKTVARQRNAPDFRDIHRVSLSEGPRLEQVPQSGEFKRGTFAEAKETYRLATYGKVFGITRQALVNDDLGAFDRVPHELGRMAAALEAETLTALLVSGAGAGPTMSDGVALFHADHGNLAAAGGAITVTTLSAARLAMRGQKGLQGELISATPRFLLVSPAKETEAEKLLAEIAAAQVAEVNPFSGKLELLVEPRLSGNAWYVVASPEELDGLEYAHLDGEPGPVLDTRAGFDVDGMEVKVRLDFGAGFVDHRGWYRNPGA